MQKQIAGIRGEGEKLTILFSQNIEILRKVKITLKILIK